MLYQREYTESPSYDFKNRERPWFRVFLAGGITNCPNWQSYTAKELQLTKSERPVLIMNPRRANFPMDDPSAAKGQIQWEFEALEVADLIVFWFPKETLCPITLFELGRWSMQNKILVVGCDPEYQRKQDVEIQMDLVRPGMDIHSNLDDFITATSLIINEFTDSNLT